MHTEWLGSVLQDVVSSDPDRLVLPWLDDAGNPAAALTVRQLDQHAAAVADLLRKSNVAPGDRVLLVYPPGLDFDAALWGCALARAVAVPVYPPDPADLPKTLPTFAYIAADCGAALALSTSGYQAAPSLAPSDLFSARPIISSS